jgi:hypothetical protein
VRVLFTNNTLEGWAGTEVWVRDMAIELLARGHSPVAYSRRLGAVARELRRATVPVVDDLERLAEPPDLIHGHHHLETMTALLRFPGVPAVAFCHGWLPAEEAVPEFPRIRRYLASDDLVRERLVAESGIPPERVVVMRNFVDLKRFRPRGPLPPRPARALILSNHASEETHLPAVRAACRAAGLTLDVVGGATGTATASPEEALAAADVVFAKGKAALEAAAMGAAVIVCDAHGLGPLVSTAELDRQRSLNFGVRLMSEPLTEEGIARRLAAYDPEDVARVRDRLRAEAGLDRAADRLLEIYSAVLREEAAQPPVEPAAELAAASRYLRSGPLRGGDPWAPEREALLARIARAEGAAEALRGALEHAQSSAHVERDRVLAAARVDYERALAALRDEREWIVGTATWRWRERLVRLRPLVAAYRWLSRRGPSS